MQETHVLVAVAKEELLLEASIHVGECAALGLKYWVKAFARHDNIKAPQKGCCWPKHDVLGHSEGLAEDNALSGGILGIALEEHK